SCSPRREVAWSPSTSPDPPAPHRPPGGYQACYWTWAGARTILQLTIPPVSLVTFRMQLAKPGFLSTTSAFTFSALEQGMLILSLVVPTALPSTRISAPIGSEEMLTPTVACGLKMLGRPQPRTWLRRTVAGRAIDNSKALPLGLNGRMEGFH